MVVSILVAFGLDAWWDGYRERIDLRDDLVNVREELEANLTALLRQRDFQYRARASIDVILDGIRDDPSATRIELSDTIVLAAFVTTPSYDPSTGAVDALISAGRLSDLEDGELKRILTEFRTKVDDLREDEINARRIAHDVVLPLFYDDPDIESVFYLTNDYYAEDFGTSPLRSKPISLRNAQGLINRLLIRRAWLDSVTREIDDLVASLEVGAQLLRAEGGEE